MWHQPCSACDTANCVTLATIERYQAGAAVLDAERTAAACRRHRATSRPASTIATAARCLLRARRCKPGSNAWSSRARRGQNGKDGKDGAPGKDGLGLNPDLPKIIDIGWQFEDKVPLQDFVRGYKNILSQPDPKAAATAMRSSRARTCRRSPSTSTKR